MVAEHTAPIKGKVVEILGHYEPIASDKKFVFDKEKLDMYMKNGAKPSNTVAKLLNANGYDLPVHVRPERKPRKAEDAKKEAPKADAGQAQGAPVGAEGEAKEGETEKSVETTEEAAKEETKEEAPVEAEKEERVDEEVKEEAPVEEKTDETPQPSTSDDAGEAGKE